MQYTCHDIKRILASPLDAVYEQDAFLEHIESCTSCRQFGILDPFIEKSLSSLLTCSAPETISLNVMESIRKEARIARPITIGTRVWFILLGAIYVIITAITLINQREIINTVVISFKEVNRIWGFFNSASKEALLTYINKVSLSPLILAALMGMTILIWIFSILRVRETN